MPVGLSSIQRQINVKLNSNQMKTMLKFWNMLILLLFLLPLTVSAQRRNTEGLKLVKRVDVKWYTKEGKLWEGWTHDVYYYYDNVGRLNGIDNKFKDGNDFYVEQYRKEGNEIKYVKLKNGKADLYDTMRFILNRDGLIRYKIYDYAIYENDFSAISSFCRYICQYDYSRSKPIRTDYNIYYKSQIPLEQIAKNVADGSEFSSLRTNGTMERACGMKKELRLYMDDDGSIYTPEVHNEPYNTRGYNYTNGNWYKKKTFLTEKNVYSERLNDTNVEFFGFGNLSLNEPSRYVEWSTEWINSRSKNLILFEDKGKKSAKTQFDYRFDMNGNIVQVKATKTEGGPNYGVYCIMDVEYEY